MFSLMFNSLAKNLTNQVRIISLRQSSYKSSISLDKLYPKSNLDPLAPPKVSFDKNDEEKFSGFIPIDKLEINYKTCSKPGGQKVNKILSGVEVRFHVDSADWIPTWIREKVKQKHINNLTKDGFLIVKSEKTRKALLNQADCMEKIRALIFEASKKPKGLSEEELAKIEINKKIADGRRLVDKRRQSERKLQRQRAIYDAKFDYYGK